MYNCPKHTLAGLSHHWEALDKMDGLSHPEKWYPSRNCLLHLLCNMAKERDTGNEGITGLFHSSMQQIIGMPRSCTKESHIVTLQPEEVKTDEHQHKVEGRREGGDVGGE